MLARAGKSCNGRYTVVRGLRTKKMKRGVQKMLNEDVESSIPDQAQLEALDHAMANLSKYTNQVLSLCPGLGIDPSKASDEDEEVDPRIKTLLQEPRISLARTLKLEYERGNLPVLGYIADPSKNNNTEAGLGPSAFMLNFDPSPHNRRTLSMSSLSSSLQTTSTTGSSSQKRIKKHWPPPLPEIHDRELKRQVFTHKSVANEFHQRLTKRELLSKHNERLEFIGDSVLGFIVSNLIYEWFPDAAEGDLTSMRSFLVCNDTLWDWATMYGLEKKLETRFELTGEVEGKKSKIIADTMEAYIGGVYMDPKGGPGVVKEWLKELLEPMMDDMEKERRSIEPLDREAKQTLYQRIGSQDLIPHYVTVSEGDGEVPFTVECRMGSEVIGVGSASNLKNAGLRAAMMALKNIRVIEKYADLRRRSNRKASAGLAVTAAAAGAAVAAATSDDNSSSIDHQDEHSRHKGTNNGPKDKLYSLIGSAEHKPRYITTRDGSGFSSQCMMSVDLMGEGHGTTKKEAEHNAADFALKNAELLTKWVSAKRRSQS